MLQDVTYQVEASLVRELLFEKPGERGVEFDRIPLQDVWDDDTDTVSDLLALAHLPADSWGWRSVERFRSVVEHEGEWYEMSTAAISMSPRTFVDARELTLELVTGWAEDQAEYRKAQQVLGKPLGPLPHGKDVAPLVFAFEAGERLVETRLGNRRELVAGDRIIGEWTPR